MSNLHVDSKFFALSVNTGGFYLSQLSSRWIIVNPPFTWFVGYVAFVAGRIRYQYPDRFDDDASLDDCLGLVSAMFAYGNAGYRRTAISLTRSGSRSDVEIMYTLPSHPARLCASFKVGKPVVTIHLHKLWLATCVAWRSRDVAVCPSIRRPSVAPFIASKLSLTSIVSPSSSYNSASSGVWRSNLARRSENRFCAAHRSHYLNRSSPQLPTNGKKRRGMFP